MLWLKPLPVVTPGMEDKGDFVVTPDTRLDDVGSPTAPEVFVVAPDSRLDGVVTSASSSELSLSVVEPFPPPIENRDVVWPERGRPVVIPVERPIVDIPPDKGVAADIRAEGVVWPSNDVPVVIPAEGVVGVDRPDNGVVASASSSEPSLPVVEPFPPPDPDTKRRKVAIENRDVVWPDRGRPVVIPADETAGFVEPDKGLPVVIPDTREGVTEPNREGGNLSIGFCIDEPGAGNESCKPQKYNQ